MGYQVQGGDTLWSIAKQQGATTIQEINEFIDDVTQLNGIKDKNLIFEGVSLKLPGDVVDISKPTRIGDMADGKEEIKELKSTSYNLSKTNLGEILSNEEGKEYATESAENSKRVLRNNGFDITGFEEKINANGETFFEKTNPDGSREFVRVVSHTDENGNKSTKVLNSVQEKGASEAKGKIYDVSEDTSIATSFSNWLKSGNTIMSSYLDSQNTLREAEENGEIDIIEYGTLMDEVLTNFEGSLSNMETFSFINNIADVTKEDGTVDLGSYAKEAESIAKEVLESLGDANNDGILTKDELSKATKEAENIIDDKLGTFDIDDNKEISVKEIIANIATADQADNGTIDGAVMYDLFGSIHLADGDSSTNENIFADYTKDMFDFMTEKGL